MGVETRYSITAPIEQKVKAERYLMGALLREPYNMPNVIGLLSRVRLSNASDGLADSFIELLEQFTTKGRYSAITIAAKTGNNALAHLAATDTEIDLAWAVENWMHVYGVWAESTALTEGQSIEAMTDGAMKMREAVDEARNRLGANGEIVETDGAETFMEWGIDKLNGIERVYKTKACVKDLGDIIGAFKPKGLYLVAARPGMGKTQFMLNQASSFHNQGAKGLYFSLEMGAEDLYRRFLGIRHGINHDSDWSTLDRATIQKAISETASIKDTVKVIDKAFSITEIEAISTAAFYKGNLDYIMVDYLQLVSGAGRKNNREEEIGGVGQALTRLAMRLNVPVIAAAQLSRNVESRGGSKRPILSDLRESGRLEQDAYCVIAPYRPEYYDIFEGEHGEDLRGTGELIVLKNRNGKIGTAKAKSNVIRGYTDMDNTSTQFPTSTPVPEPDFSNHRPSSDEDIPF